MRRLLRETGPGLQGRLGRRGEQSTSKGNCVVNSPELLITRTTSPAGDSHPTNMSAGPVLDAGKPPVQLGSAVVCGSAPVKSEHEALGLRHINRNASDASANTAPDAVAILALVSKSNTPLSTIIILQFRPPVNKIVVELPAGLVDENESVQGAALRELREESGRSKKSATS
ncbi:hypothetical protein PCASD_18424 [Puccinia coronata f. sp. avenae]|uniref:Nudix hydrolase domain-containing protein n=2 Tax=Puccinia coronata f. sp. avenae TaxID=200324 RepID=A0A2N5TTI3_9BASI|nr:hypothetical protein PCASD_22659 [Puccinia coronata f. sp. avenae]PLW28794.1 hypothetical protein PCASD_18424 [Puccinia coronata f. sp. avenae]